MFPMMSMSWGMASLSAFISSINPRTASLMFYMASSTVRPSDMHPGKAGTVTTYIPSSSFSMTTVNLINFIME